MLFTSIDKASAKFKDIWLFAYNVHVNKSIYANVT